MALSNDVTFDNGVKIKYHKISNVSFEGSKVKLTVECYTDESYRNKEKESSIAKKRYEELTNFILEENKKIPVEKDFTKIVDATNEANELTSKFNFNQQLSVLSMNFIYEDITDMSMSNFYSLLKKEEIFKDSKDI